MVVRRAMTLSAPGTPMSHSVLAPFYSMGHFHASGKRRATSWSITLSVAALVRLLKWVAYPYRSMVDAGVVVGLTWGATSIVAVYARALAGNFPAVDPELPK